MCADGDPRVIDVVRRRVPEARICHIDKALPGAARNLLVDEARGDLLLFLDDDVTVDPDLLARLDRLAREHPECDVFGGPNDTPPGSTQFQVTQGAVLASIVGSGPVRRRYGAHPAGRGRRAVLHPLQPRRPAQRHGRVRVRPRLRRGERRARRDVASEACACTTTPSWSPSTSAERRSTGSPGRCTSTGAAAVSCSSDVGPASGSHTSLRPRCSRTCWSHRCSRSTVTPLLIAPAVLYAAAVAAGAAWIAVTLRRPVEAIRAAGLILVLHACYGTGVARGLVAPQRGAAAPTVREWVGSGGRP